MKKIYVFVFCILGMFPLLALTGCESLDYTPSDQMSEKTFWQTEEHARQAALGMYAAMKAPWCFGMEFTFDMCSDLADGTSPWADISRGTAFSSASGGVQNHWQNLYELVHRANTVIRKVAGMPISGETIDRVTGEAKFCVQWHISVCSIAGAVCRITMRHAT